PPMSGKQYPIDLNRTAPEALPRHELSFEGHTASDSESYTSTGPKIWCSRCGGEHPLLTRKNWRKIKEKKEEEKAKEEE
ncbi:hypothetical protein PMAYCL1PPCAC_01429, partial [Pristionchus mayeri]